MSKCLFFALSLSLISFTMSYTIPDYSCGTPSPQKEKDCTKYGTDSGFLCCWIKNEMKNTVNCTLISYSLAETIGIKGTLTDQLKGNYYSCGNSSSYLAFAFILFVLIGLIL